MHVERELTNGGVEHGGRRRKTEEGDQSNPWEVPWSVYVTCSMPRIHTTIGRPGLTDIE